jgi:DNA repair exonuclease SbcCD nuclease subunit
LTSLITSDLHFTDNPRDEYRWALWPWMRKQQWDELILLGDLTDAKDRHSERLVNRIVEEVRETSISRRLILLRGNHDFIDEKNPFFRFLSVLPNVQYVNSPQEIRLKAGLGLFLPCMKTGFPHINPGPYTWVFTHQTFDGSKAENGTRLTGVDPSLIHPDVQVISGDVHVPQTVHGNITYTGSPYRIKFGDTFKPRLLRLEKDKRMNVYFPGVTRELLTIGADCDIAGSGATLKRGDQVKVRVQLKRVDYPRWPEIRRAVKTAVEERGWQLCGLELTEIKTKVKQIEITEKQLRSPKMIVKEYAKAHRLEPNLLKVGLDLIK